jgi:hypothetical protein
VRDRLNAPAFVVLAAANPRSESHRSQRTAANHPRDAAVEFARRIVVRTQFSKRLWHVKLDASEFELSLLNLAVNARDAMIVGGELTIAARNIYLASPNSLNLTGDFVAVSMRDTAGYSSRCAGTGIRTIWKGTGLGLSQVGFAQQAGGTVTVPKSVRLSAAAGRS